MTTSLTIMGGIVLIIAIICGTILVMNWMDSR